jgi:heme/copper-type cytochrome/quinol oxidase subunit 2
LITIPSILPFGRLRWRGEVLAAFCVLSLSGLAATVARAADPVTLTLKDHRFTPSQVTVPAGERFRIEVVNQDTTPAEFESSDLRVEKIVVPGGKITVNAGPLKPGTYKFFDDYHPDQATGTITSVERKAQE